MKTRKQNDFYPKEPLLFSSNINGHLLVINDIDHA